MRRHSVAITASRSFMVHDQSRSTCGHRISIIFKFVRVLISVTSARSILQWLMTVQVNNLVRMVSVAIGLIRFNLWPCMAEFPSREKSVPFVVLSFIASSTLPLCGLRLKKNSLRAEKLQWYTSPSDQ